MTQDSRPARTPATAASKPAADDATGAQPAAKKKAAAKKAATRKTAAKKPASKKPASASRAKPKATQAAAGPAPAETPKSQGSRTAARAESAHGAPDFERLGEYLSDVAGRAGEIIQEFADQNGAEIRRRTGQPVDPLDISGAFADVIASIAANPYKLVEAQFKLWSDYARLWESVAFSPAGAPAVAEPDASDKRFRHKDWSENKALDVVKQSYLIFGRWMEEVIAGIDDIDPHKKRRAQFYTKQFVNALAPSNFMFTNPEVVEATLESKGENLIRGLRNYLEDLQRGNGTLSIRQSDMEYFKVGENIATTPGKVVFRNRLFELIQYEPTTKTVAKRPLLVFPPWINKFYIMDLRPENSFVRWMTDQGRTVMLVSWVNPTKAMKDVGFSDYVKEGVYEALDAVEKATGESEVDAIGYCIGGTMLSTALAHMAATGDDRIKSATFFAAQTEFSDPGELQLFIDEKQLKNIEQQMDAAGGVLEGHAMASTFNMLRSNDLIWSFVINNYMKGSDPKRFDLLFWNADATRMAKRTHLDYLRNYYLDNLLAKGALEIDGVPLDLSKVTIPVFMQAAETDHIAPYPSVYRGAKLWGGSTEYMLSGSGHIAGVINHPDAEKYHHSINRALPDTLDEWIAGAEKHAGSWWPHWIAWLNGLSSEQVEARVPGEGGLPALEDAPGSYVKVMS
ncbi:MAG: class I poly(R)-hydroxyalkanoic acid synthase [Pseudomonadota bacterium]